MTVVPPKQQQAEVLKTTAKTASSPTLFQKLLGENGDVLTTDIELEEVQFALILE